MLEFCEAQSGIFIHGVFGDSPQDWLRWQRPLRNRKTQVRFIIFSQRATIWWKFGENRSSKYSGNWSQILI